MSKDHIPDIICSEEQMKKFKNVSKQRPKDTDTQKKIACAERIKQQGSVIGKKRKAPKNRSQVQPKKRTRRKSSQELERENVKLRKECDQLKIEKKDLKSQVSEVHAKVKRLQKKINALAEDLQTQNCVFEGKLKTLKYELSKRSFTYDCLINNGEEFFELCGLTSKEFDCLFDCLEPFTDLLIYPDCSEKDNKTNFNNRKLDRKTELLAALTIARHNVDLMVMGKLVGPNDSTMSRIFVAWMTLIRCVFDCIDPAPLPGFIESFLPKKFVDAGYAECGILGDNTETWLSQFENFDTNNLTFSH